MRSLGLCRSTFGMAAAAALVAACSGPWPSLSASPSLRVTKQTGSSGYQLIHGFGDPGRLHRNAGGINPDGALIDVNGTLYGTTSWGGLNCHRVSGFYANSCGTVFSVSPSGKWRPVYRFRGGSDGSRPNAGLIAVHGTLYGTTVTGGNGCYSPGCGTVFSVTTAGAEKVVYSFKGGSDGEYPFSPLIFVKGKLYGTTFKGGNLECGGESELGCGTVYSVSPSGTEQILHKFQGNSGDGFAPWAGLTDVNGALYGTTLYGGGSGCYVLGCGTVFSITTGGKETKLYSFQGGSDGGHPLSSLVSLNGELYGTTVGAEGKSSSELASGTVFSITTAGTEKVLYDFGYKSAQGWSPFGGLVDVNGTLYGTTQFGGACASSSVGCGTIFSITTSGALTELYNFTGIPDSADPRSALLDVNGTLYGTSEAGGNTGCMVVVNNTSGCGTVYAFTP
jgi:uncharacterized repeat protein (TIGR03803 family)